MSNLQHAEPPAGTLSQTSERRIDVTCAVAVSLVVAGVALLLSRTTLDNYDGIIMGQVATGIVDHHSIAVLYDGYHLNTPHSFYGIGMSLLMIPGLLGAKVVGASEAAGIMVTNVWLLGLLGGAAYVWCRVRRCSVGYSVLIALVIGLGMGILPFASTGFAEVALALSIVVGLIGLSALSRGWSWGPVVVGAAVGAAIVTRDDSILLVAPWLLVGGFVLGTAGHRRGVVVRMVLGGLPFLALWAWYNEARWGAPWKVGYSGVLRFNHSFFAGLYGLLLSPGKGLILYAPITLAAVWGLALMARRERALTAVVALLVLSRIVFFAPYWGWYAGGGFGPRYVLPAVPALALGLMELARRSSQLLMLPRLGIGGLALLSVFVGFVGGAVGYQTNSLNVGLSGEPAFHKTLTTPSAFLGLYEAPSSLRIVDRHMFDWGEFPITNETSSLVARRDIVSAGLTRPADKLRDAGALVLVVLGLGGLLTLFRRRPRSSRT